MFSIDDKHAQSKVENTQNQGFTLIEMALSMIIVGLMIAPFFQIYSNYQEREKREVTDTNVQQAVSFIQEYRKANGFYPCPAQIDALTNTPAYGRAVDCEVLASAYHPTNLGAGNCTAGICMEQATAARQLALTDFNVIVGALPFRDLQMGEEAALDGYGARLMYAVTYSMTDRASFDDTLGAISILDSTGNQQVLPQGAADYIILSTGKTRAGAYSREGALVNACAGASEDTENCNVGFQTGTPVSADSVYVAALRSEAVGANFYDDTIAYHSEDRVSPWKRTDANKEDIESLALDDVGIGTPTPTANLMISSIGAGDPPALRVSGGAGNDGKIYTDLVCDLSGNCFTPENIGGNNTSNPADGVTPGDGMKCPAGQYMVGVKDGRAECAAVIDIVCPSSEPIMQGITAAGVPICVKIPGASCAAMIMTQCLGHPTAPDVNLPLAGDGGTSGAMGAGDCHNQDYICDIGTWKTSGPSWGACTDGVTIPENPLCTSVTGYGPGPLFNYTKKAGTDCTGAIDTLRVDCTCIGVGSVAPCPSCPTGFSGIVPTYNQAKKCRGGNILNWWQTPRTAPWPAGNDSTVLAECGPTSSYCTCIDPVVLTREVPLACPDPVNTVTNPLDPYRQPQAWDSPTCQWVNSGPPLGGCICKGTAIAEAVPITCPLCNEQPLAGTNYFDRDPVTCLKDPLTLHPVAGLPLPNSIPATCNPLDHFWRDQTPSGAPLSTVTKFVNDPCNCSVFPPASNVNCKKPDNSVHSCKCLP